MLKRISILLLILAAPAVSSAAFPKPTGFVNDFANVIAADTKPQIDRVLKSFESETGNEIAVVTLPSLEGRTVEDVAADLYKEWGIGKKGRDNGVLFLIAPKERKTRIEVGYGLEGVINDALAGRILDEFVLPHFKEGDLSAGIASGAEAIVNTITNKEGIAFDAGASLEGSAPRPVTTEERSLLSVVIKVIFLIFLAYLFIRHPWLFLLFLSGTGRRGGGGFSGGFGGFGGGLSGGGGASRGW